MQNTVTQNVTHIEHFGIARKIISNMTSESWETIPHACITYEADVTAFMDELNKINAGLAQSSLSSCHSQLQPSVLSLHDNPWDNTSASHFQAAGSQAQASQSRSAQAHDNSRNNSQRITVNTAMLRVIVEGIKYCPAINGHIQFNRRLVRGTVKTLSNIDISMPVILKTGEMMTLNMHGMENKSLSQIRDAVADSLRRADNSNLNEVMYEVSMDNTIQNLKKGMILQTLFRLIGSKTGKYKVRNLKGKDKKAYYSIPENQRLTKHDIEQGTITVSNLGSVKRNWNGQCTLLEIVPPQLTAIAIGAVTRKPVCSADGTVTTALILPLTIAFDHRALDAGDIMPFLDKLDEIFSHPQVLEEWL